MSDEPKIQLPRSGGGNRRPARSFDLDNPTAVTAETPAPMAGPQTQPVPPAAPGNAVAHMDQAAPQAPSYLARPDIPGGTVPPWSQPAPQPAPGGNGGGMAIPMSAFIAPTDPETDTTQSNTRIPKYLVTALKLAGAAHLHGVGSQGQHLAAALRAYLPPEIIAEARRILYPHLPPQQ